MSDKVDFTKCITEHIVWNMRLRCFLDGGECITEQEAVSAEKCLLGAWLNSSRADEYKGFPEFAELDLVHRKIHEQVKLVIRAKNSGNKNEAEKELVILHTLNDSIINLLTKLDEYFEGPSQG